MLNISIDTKEWDGMVTRLQRGLRPELVNLVGARTEEKLIRDSYLDRWDAAIGGNSKGYLNWKLKVGAGDQPGILTGSTLRALTSKADANEGEVFLQGSWPNDPSTSSFKEQLSHNEIEDLAHGIGTMEVNFYNSTGVDTDDEKTKRWGFIASEPFSSKRFGVDRFSGAPEVDFMTPGPGDAAVIGVNVSHLVDFLIDPGTGAPLELLELLGDVLG